MSKVHVKKGDKVMVITGRDKGKTGEVLQVDTEKSRVTVSGVNILTHHNKPKSKEDKGGIVKAPGTIDSSNVMIVCPTCNQPRRTGSKISANGKKVRTCTKCGTEIVIAKATVKKTKEPKAKKEVKE